MDSCGLLHSLTHSLLLLTISGVALASTLHVSPEQMATCWEAFSMNKNVSELTDHTFQSYRTQLCKDSEVSLSTTTTSTAIQSRKIKRESSSVVTPPPPKRRQQQQQPNGTPPSSSVDSVAQTTLASPKRAAVVLPKYEQRVRVGEVMASYNPPVEGGLAPFEGLRKTGRCVVSSLDSSNVQKPYRYMFTTVEERSAALEKHLVQMGNNIIETYGISDGENGIAPLEQVNVPRQDKICCVGRVCNEVSQVYLVHTYSTTQGRALTHMSCFSPRSYYV